MTQEVLNWIKKEKLIQEDDAVIIGLSGGADSVALLLVLAQLREKMGYTMFCVHVEHGIRGEESRADAAFAETLCRKKQIPCEVYPVCVPAYARERGIGYEEAARELRYECFRRAAQKLQQTEKRPVKIALAHHADDNAETVLFQMARGSGLHGMCGMRSQRPFAQEAVIIRPLLTVSRAQIEDYLKIQKQDYCTDSTNADITYSRNRIRHEVLPQLAKVNAQAAAHINQSAFLLQQAVSYFEEETKRAMQQCCILEDGTYTILQKAWEQYPQLLQQELIHQILGNIAGSRRDITMVHVQQVCALMQRQVSRHLILPCQIQAHRIYEGIKISKTQVKQQEKQECYVLTEADMSLLNAGETLFLTLSDAKVQMRLFPFLGKFDQIPKNKYTKWLNYDRIECDLQFRKRAAGDYLTIDADAHKKKLKNYFIDAKIPQRQRDDIWLLAQQSHVLWVAGGRMSAVCRIKQDTKQILEIRMDGGNDCENQTDSCAFDRGRD